MKTLREKITFILTALLYLFFHLGQDQSIENTLEAIIVGTLYHMLQTAPYALGGTLVAQIVCSKLSGVRILPWDRLLRIFFTIAICFSFFLAMYYHGERNLPEPEPEGQDAQPRIARYLPDVAQSAP